MDIEGIKFYFVAMWESFVDAVVRFWNNRFRIDNDEVLYLREQISLLQIRNNELVDKLITPAQAVQPIQDEEEFKPISSNRIPWHQRRMILEQASRTAAMKLANQAAEATGTELKAERTQTTAEIEEALGIN